MNERPFWSRGIAFAIDVAFLGVVGLVLISSAREWIVSLGNGALVVGWAIAATYFGTTVALFGQTLGQAMLGLRVVAIDGQKLSAARSFGRAAMLSFGYAMNNFPGRFGPLIAPLFAMVALPQIYLVLFNRSSGQLWHDVWFKSGVRRDKIDARMQLVGSDPVLAPPLSRVHKILLGSICALALCGGVWQALMGSTLDPFLRGLIGENNIDAASYSTLQGGFYTFGKQPTIHSENFVLTVHTVGEPSSPDALAMLIAKKAMTEVPGAVTADRLVVNLRWGLNVGIASYSSGKTITHKPEEWLGEK